MPNTARLAGVFSVLLLASLLLASPGVAAALPAPEGAVVVTVGGNIANTNRGAFDPDRDLFLKYHDVSFDKAAAFDRAMLEELGMHAVAIAFEGGPAPVLVAGTPLEALVAAGGGVGRAVHEVGAAGKPRRD